jgi:hypothetical protein
MKSSMSDSGKKIHISKLSDSGRKSKNQIMNIRDIDESKITNIMFNEIPGVYRNPSMNDVCASPSIYSPTIYYKLSAAIKSDTQLEHMSTPDDTQYKMRL